MRVDQEMVFVDFNPMFIDTPSLDQALRGVGEMGVCSWTKPRDERLAELIYARWRVSIS